MTKIGSLMALFALSILLGACSGGGTVPPTGVRAVQDSGGVMPGH